MVVREIVDLITIFGGEFGWVFATIVILYEMAWPSSIGPFDLWDTKLQQQLKPLEKKLDTILTTQTHQIQIIRAMARKVEGVNSNEVDNYLRKNGVSVDTFIEDNNDD